MVSAHGHYASGDVSLDAGGNIEEDVLIIAGYELIVTRYYGTEIRVFGCETGRNPNIMQT